MRNSIVIVLAGAVFGALSALAVPATVAKAQDCDMTINNNKGARQRWTCWYYGFQGCEPNVCEEDTCNINCPTGEIYFCVGFQYCGSNIVNGCQGLTCV